MMGSRNFRQILELIAAEYLWLDQSAVEGPIEPQDSVEGLQLVVDLLLVELYLQVQNLEGALISREVCQMHSHKAGVHLLTVYLLDVFVKLVEVVDFVHNQMFLVARVVLFG